MAGPILDGIQTLLFVADAILGEIQVWLFLAGILFGETQVSLIETIKEVLGEVQLSLILPAAELGEQNMYGQLGETRDIMVQFEIQMTKWQPKSVIFMQCGFVLKNDVVFVYVFFFAFYFAAFSLKKSPGNP